MPVPRALKVGQGALRSLIGENSRVEQFLKHRYLERNRRRINTEKGPGWFQIAGNGFALIGENENFDGPRRGVALRGGCDLPSLFTGIPLIHDGIKGSVAISRERSGGVGSHASSQLVQMLDGVPEEATRELRERLNISEHQFTTTFYGTTLEYPVEPRYGEFPRTVVVMSGGTDIIRTLYRNKKYGYIVDPGGWWLNRDMGEVLGDLSNVEWFRKEFEKLGRITIDDYMKNVTTIVTELRARAQAEPIIYATLVVDPQDLTHNYQLVKQAHVTRRREFHIRVARTIAQAQLPHRRRRPDPQGSRRVGTGRLRPLRGRWHEAGGSGVRPHSAGTRSRLVVDRQDVFPIFVGSGRSGTTLLRTIFDAHPDLAMAHEPQFVGTVARKEKMLNAGGFDLHRFLETIYANSNFRRMGLERQEVETALAGDPPRNLSDAVRAVFSLWAVAQGKPRYGDKTPGYIIQIPEMARLFPETRFVNVIRDGRNVALSYLERPWGPSTIVEGALYWRSRVGRGRKAGLNLGPERYLEVRYEDLVADTEPAVRRVCEFLGLRWEPEMLRYHEKASKFVADSHEPDAFRNVARPPTKGTRDWSDVMSDKDIAVFEAIAGDLLRDLGYQTRSSGSSLQAQVRASWERVKWSSKRARAFLSSRLRR